MEHALKVTRALIKFIEDHGGSVDNDLNRCETALVQKDQEEAVARALKVKPHGMGGITDWWPDAINQNESTAQNEIILLALVNEWCRQITVLDGEAPSSE